VIEHNAGINPTCFTYKRRPVTLVYYTGFSDPVEGIEFEKQIKGWSTKKKEALINGDIGLLKMLSLSYRQIHFINELEDFVKDIQPREQTS
jgi:putative endonuclease